MQAILSEQLGEHLFKVYFDEDHDFGNDALSSDIVEEIKNGSLEVFGVEKLIKCKCCENYNHVDSLWGIIDTSATNALKYFLDEFNS